MSAYIRRAIGRERWGLRRISERQFSGIYYALKSLDSSELRAQVTSRICQRLMLSTGMKGFEEDHLVVTFQMH